MDNICDYCAGCAACTNICPRDAISMHKDNEGFYKYTIDSNKCIDCGLCQEVCPESDRVCIHKENNYGQKYYAARNKNLSCVRESSSGGAFSSFAKTIINKGGSVYGVIIEYPECKITYKRAICIEDTYPMRGSKYIQAELSKELVVALLDDIKNARPVLFAGTSCYVKGIQNLIKKKGLQGDNIFFMDFVCAGVISPHLWEKEVNHYAEKLGELTKVSFREKWYGWRDFNFLWQSNNKKERVRFTLSNIGLLQSKSEAIGKHCNNCKYRSYDRPGDITVGDFWNEQYLPKKWWDDKGVSALLVNTHKGEALLNASSEGLEIIAVEKTMVFNSRFISKETTIDNSLRARMYADARDLEYKKFIEKWINVSFANKFILGFIRPIFLKMGIHRFKK